MCQPQENLLGKVLTGSRAFHETARVFPTSIYLPVSLQSRLTTPSSILYLSFNFTCFFFSNFFIQSQDNFQHQKKKNKKIQEQKQRSDNIPQEGKKIY